MTDLATHRCSLTGHMTPSIATERNALATDQRDIALVTLATRSSALEPDVLVGFGICDTCSSSCSPCLHLRAGWCSDSLEIEAFLFTLVDTRRDMLEKRTTQHQYMDKMDHSDLYQQSWTEVVDTHDNDQLFFPWCEFSPLPSWKVAPPSPLFNVGNK